MKLVSSQNQHTKTANLHSSCMMPWSYVPQDSEETSNKKTGSQKRFLQLVLPTTIKHRSIHTTITRFTNTGCPIAIRRWSRKKSRYQGHEWRIDRLFHETHLRDLVGEESGKRCEGASFRTKLGPWRAGDPQGTPRSLSFSFPLALFLDLFSLRALCVSSSSFFSTSLLPDSWSYSSLSHSRCSRALF